jgi:serine/threonine protein kinase/tetratricopeptide (TPR) repeat protein
MEKEDVAPANETPDSELPTVQNRVVSNDLAPGTEIIGIPCDAEASTFVVKSPRLAGSPEAMGEAGKFIASRYRLIEIIGEGGMGSVWRAEQIEPVKRFVAIKLIKPGMDSRAVLSQFELERQALAIMDHPNIAKILDGGVYDDRPYFVMELVDGVPITEFCDSHRLTPRERLELFVPVCHAIQHAHQKGIIHRDIKPSNVLITKYDNRPVPKVIDFGIAKATSGTIAERLIKTNVGDIVGTPQYMSPEQANVTNLDIDTRSDIYSLGVLLYELLVGIPPFSAKEFQHAGMLEILRVVREEEPPKPSTKLSLAEALPTLSANRGTEPKKLTGLLRNELDWVVMKALEKDRSRRYETANGFAADILRYLTGEPVQAHPPSSSYRLMKFVKRNRAQVVAASLVFLTLIGGIIGTSLGLIRAEKAREDAVIAQLAEAESAKRERLAKQEALEQKAKAEKAVDDIFIAYRDSTSDAIEHLIGSKTEIGLRERKYIENTLKRWQEFSDRQGDDEQTLRIRAEGHFRVGTLWMRLGRDVEARNELNQAVKTLEPLQAKFEKKEVTFRQLPGNIHHNLGMLSLKLGDVTEARKHYFNALKIYQGLVDDFPTDPEFRYVLTLSHNNLAILFERQEDRTTGDRHYLSAIGILEKLVSEFPANPEYQKTLATNHANRGVLLKHLGKLDAAVASYKQATDNLEELCKRSPDVPEYRYLLANTLFNQGGLSSEKQQAMDAESYHQRSVTILEKMVEEFPVVPEYRRLLAKNYLSLAKLVVAFKERTAEAEKRYNQAAELMQPLATEFPVVFEYHEILANITFGLGVLQVSQSRFPEGIANYKKSIQVRQSLVKDFPKSTIYPTQYGGSFINLGNAYCLSNNSAEAIEHYSKAIQIFTQLCERSPQDASLRSYLRNAYQGRGYANTQLGKYAEVINDLDKVIEFSPTDEQPAHRASRAVTLVKADRIPEAVKEVEALLQGWKWNGAYHLDYAGVYAVASRKIVEKKQEYSNRAMELIAESLRLGYKKVERLKSSPDFEPLRDRDDFKKLIAELEKKK